MKREIGTYKRRKIFEITDESGVVLHYSIEGSSKTFTTKGDAINDIDEDINYIDNAKNEIDNAPKQRPRQRP